jgi:hypothetical protein
MAEGAFYIVDVDMFSIDLVKLYKLWVW